MFPHQFIGKMALRTKHVQFHGGGIDRSFIDSPVTIMAATESHIVVRYEGQMGKMLSNKTTILGPEYNDNNWTSYDDLMALADEKHIELMKKLNA